ncbi:MAG: DUF3306 domain-containing protein [Thiohalophilus sp.]|jgi:hypothetical protein
MSDSSNSQDNQAPSFLTRWSRRKQEQAQQPGISEITKVPVEQVASEPVAEPLSPPAIPDVDTLDENSEVSMFFTEQVSETIKRKALRKLFHMDKFNICDGLDDYAEDYTKFEPLGDVITAHQRLREERESLNKLVSDEAQDLENEISTEDVEKLAEHDTTSSSFEQESSDNDERPAGAEQKEG